MQQSSLRGDSNQKDEANIEKKTVNASIINYLEDFGLQRREAEIYYILSRLGSASANEISNAAQYNRLQTYRSIKALVDRGMIEISLERPRKYTSLKIEHVISLLQQEAANKIMQLENKKPLLLQKWSEIDDLPISIDSYRFRIIQGSKNVFKFAIMLFNSADKKIDLAIKGNEIIRWIKEDTDNSLQEKPQIKVRLISELNNFNTFAIERFLEFCEFGHVSSLNTVPMALIDDQEVLICLNANSQGIPENAIWTNHPDLVSMLSSFYDILWSKAKIQQIAPKNNLK
jgi:sugar-specific transcriptional regulator TrmB